MLTKEHKGLMRFLTISISVFVMMAVLVFTARSDDFTSRQQQRLARKIISDRVGTPMNDLSVANFASTNYELQGVTVTNFKVVDERTGETYLVTLDDKGVEYDNEALHAAEAAAYEATFGKLDPALVEMVAGLRGSDRVEVILWLKGPDDSALMGRPDPRDEVFLDPAALDSHLMAVDATYATALETAVAPVAARLNTMGYAATTNSSAPVVHATLSVADLQQISKWSEVLWIYPSVINQPDDNSDVEQSGVTPENEPEVVRTKQVTGVNTVHQRGVSGFFIRVAQIEVEGRIATANPFLREVTATTNNVCATASGHSTGVAGIIRGLAPGGDLGIAPGSMLWTGGSCTGNSTELQARSTAAADWGARSINLSWGSNTNLILSANDRFYDTMVINRFRTVVKSAGNRDVGCGLEGNVTSPGLAYNIITVGNYNANVSPFAMNSCSSWRNPRSNSDDRIKPEVAAPGTNIRSTTTASPWMGNIGSGTSYSAPVVTGVSALMMNRSASLASWPEAVKAILMATATTNIEGAARLSTRDGAGGIQAQLADDVSRGVSGNWGAQSYSCTTATPLNVTTMPLVAGKRTRVVIAWDQNPDYVNYGGTTSRPSADLDLRIISPSGTQVAFSASFDNTYEIVDFTPTVTGNYQLRVVRFRCDLTPKWLGWAWYRFP